MGRQPGTLRMASVNIASGRDDDGVVRLPRVAEALAGLDADVIALQEIDHLLPRSGVTDQSAVLGEACRRDGPPWETRFAAAIHGTPGPGGDSWPSTTSRGDIPSYGVALLSRHPIAWTRELRLAPARGRRPIPLPPGTRPPVWFIADEQRVALAAVLHTPLGTMTVVTTHLSFAPGRAALQLKRLRTWAADLPRPLVLMGDLNLPGALPRVLTGWTSLVQAPTFPAGRPRIQLDHALAAGLDRQVAAASAVGIGGSDHRAILIDLS